MAYFLYYYNFADRPGLQMFVLRLVVSRLDFHYPTCQLPLSRLSSIHYTAPFFKLCRNHAAAGVQLLQPLTKTFMSIFKRIKRAIATWLLETDSESEDADHEENPVCRF
ncbi:hypothetical protein EV421DRAFT_1740053 [Armillaria borealis]|uniref:Uncharacterized protein n=1 Tax=Armillaria borealis TaxID=47425 RepID=A0AA39J445_9AGAR|nr:hypothetical protein EV421DRAFT_1740053 [Armillaria borealis]